MISLGELAEQFGLELSGNPATEIRGVGTISNASADQLTFLANPKYGKHLMATKAGAVVLHPNQAEQCPTAALISTNPYASFARIAAVFDQSRSSEPGIHPSAHIGDDCLIDASASIGPQVVIESGSHVGANATIGAGCFIGRNCQIADGVFLHPRVALYADVQLGKRTIIHSGAVIGADGFGIAFDDGAWIKVPQLGGVRIGADCEIGANTTIDRGAIEPTVLEDDVRVDNQVQIAHNCHIGAHTAMAGCSAIAGSTTIGRYCLVGGGAGVVGHLELCDRVTVTAMSLVTHSIAEPGEYSSGSPLQSSRDWRKNAVRTRQLDDIARRLRKLER